MILYKLHTLILINPARLSENKRRYILLVSNNHMLINLFFIYSSIQKKYLSPQVLNNLLIVGGKQKSGIKFMIQLHHHLQDVM